MSPAPFGNLKPKKFFFRMKLIIEVAKLNWRGEIFNTFAPRCDVVIYASTANQFSALKGVRENLIGRGVNYSTLLSKNLYIKKDYYERSDNCYPVEFSGLISAVRFVLDIPFSDLTQVLTKSTVSKQETIRYMSAAISYKVAFEELILPTCSGHHSNLVNWR
jgi:hypothetical protein